VLYSCSSAAEVQGGQVQLRLICATDVGCAWGVMLSQCVFLAAGCYRFLLVCWTCVCCAPLFCEKGLFAMRNVRVCASPAVLKDWLSLVCAPCTGHICCQQVVLFRLWPGAYL
jgi:hypothetical protein